MDRLLDLSCRLYDYDTMLASRQATASNLVSATAASTVRGNHQRAASLLTTGAKGVALVMHNLQYSAVVSKRIVLMYLFRHCTSMNNIAACCLSF